MGSIEDVELGTLRWIDWIKRRRLCEECGVVPPAELEKACYAQRRRPAAGLIGWQLKQMEVGNLLDMLCTPLRCASSRSV
jgi:hypothetical protein